MTRNGKVSVLEARVEARHSEYMRRFDELETKISDVGKDVKSLLDSRSFSRGRKVGIWTTVTLVAGMVAFAISTAIAWFRSP